MTDRDDYPDPYRRRADREGGYDYDPLSDPLPAQPPSRGRRARPGPPDSGEFGHTGPSTGEFRTPRYADPGPAEFDTQNPAAPPPGRRRRAEPPEDQAAWGGEQPTAPPRRFGAADALRGSRAARGGGQDTQRPAQGSPSDTGSHQRPAPGSLSDTGSHQRPGSDPTQEALAALANLGGAQNPGNQPGPGAPTAPSTPVPGAHDEPPRRARRARAEDPGEGQSPFWGDDADEPTPAFLADDAAEEPKGRRARRKRAKQAEAEPLRDSGTFSAQESEAEEPKGRRGRRRARRAAEEAPADSGAFLAQEPVDEEPAGRRGRRRAAPEPEEEPRHSETFATAPVTDTGAFAELSNLDDEEPLTDTGSFLAQEPEAEEPKGRRGRRRSRRGRRAEPEPEPRAEEEPEEVEEDLYEEDSLEDIAASYGDSRANRKRAKRAKAAQAARRNAGKPKRRKSKGLMILLVLVLMLVVAGGGFAVMRTYVFPPDHGGSGEGEVVFTIAEGQSGTAVGQSLVEQGVVASVRAFTNALGEQGDALVPGTYSLAENMSGESAVAALLDPENRLGGRVTIREGLRSEQVLQHLADNTGLSLEELQDAYAQTGELGLPDYATEGAAGYLFPSTYRFEPDTEPLSILRTMVTQYRQVAEELDLEARAADLGYDANEVMAIASIVQAESGGVDDMAKISRVVHNRLDIDMMLQMDSTCFYAIGEYGIALNNDQLAQCESDTSGFDTYHKTGLIPGPFVAPGEDAIEAALEPEDGEWLYFVATDPENGVTEFAETYEEFEVLKQRFQETWGGGGQAEGEGEE
ncbi:endolytic transglycosylase MltG [Nocardiopsis valliformis]|uniref:endolytic transglycosylase MltG n=1 Tax=Nocardiopsis valliformis TaxID=239974 RepID=UPI000348E704|nr:endolytic transglycosylase MltG [Nocardiopsis valliformis]